MITFKKLVVVEMYCAWQRVSTATQILRMRCKDRGRNQKRFVNYAPDQVYRILNTDYTFILRTSNFVPRTSNFIPRT